MYLVNPLALGFMYIDSLAIIAAIKGSHVPIGFLIAFAITLLWMLLCIIFRSALIKIEGKSITSNKKDISDTLNHFFVDVVLNEDELYVLRSFKPSGGWPIWGRIITVLLKDNIIYLNITSTGKTDTPTYIHGFYDYLRARRIAEFYKSFYEI